MNVNLNSTAHLFRAQEITGFTYSTTTVLMKS